MSHSEIKEVLSSRGESYLIETLKCCVLDNGDDGKKHTLRSRKVKCSMLFAVYVSNEEKLEHDITYGKTGTVKYVEVTRIGIEYRGGPKGLQPP